MRYGSGFRRGLAGWFFFCLVFTAGAQASERTRLADISRTISHNGQGVRAHVQPVPLAASHAGLDFNRRSDTTLARRWSLSKPRLEAEADWLASCSRGACRDTRVEPWMTAVALIRAVPRISRPARVQAFLSRRIHYVSDRVIDDHWANPLATLLSRAGDCEDHALLKRAMLMAAGFSDAEVPLLVLETAEGQGHMTLLVAQADHALVLDNRFRRPVRLASLGKDRIVAVASGAGYFVAR
ncbi:transglutaminase-like cysteine peptidase [Roseibium sp.]|uniref:transglutaminase-like cysteine peptidase n=1 Tax=Roseibium sp. TaxID=1936156 RepID=UPI003BAC8D88